MAKKTKQKSTNYNKIKITVNPKEKAFIKKRTKEMGFIYMSDFIRYQVGI
jgi:hypothetical protein